MKDTQKAQEIERIRERKKENRDKAARIKDAERRLLVPPTKTRRSLKMIHYDPAGVMHFEDGRWVKVFKVTGGVDEIPEIVDKAVSTLHFTHYYGGTDHFFLTLTTQGESYEDARQIFAKDEEIINAWIKAVPLSMEELTGQMRKISGIEGPFSFDECMKKRRDLAEAILPKIKEEENSFTAKKMQGCCYFVARFHNEIRKSMTDCFKSISDEMFLSFDLRRPTKKELEKIWGHLADRYEESLKSGEIVQVVLCCCKVVLSWKDDTGIKDKIFRVMEEYGKLDGLILPDHKFQKEDATLAYALGLMDESRMSCEGSDYIYELFKKEYEHDSD